MAVFYPNFVSSTEAKKMNACNSENLRELFTNMLGKHQISHAEVRMVDLDSLGVVHSNVYLIFFEDGFLSFMKSIGVSCSTFDSRGVTFPVVSATCDYRKPAYFEDELEILSSVSNLGNSSFACNHKVFRQEKDTKQLCAEGKMIRVVMKDLKLVNLSDIPISKI